MADVRLSFDRFHMDKEGCRAFLRSAPVLECVGGFGNRIAATANSMYPSDRAHYGCNARVGKTRARAFVYTANKNAIRSNLKRNTLIKSAMRGR